MRTICVIIAVFSWCGLQAQGYVPSSNRELPRSEVLPYPTEQAANARNGADHTYFARLGIWMREDAIFSTSFTVPFAWANRQVIFHVGSASSDYEIRVNGRTVAYNANPNTPAEFNLTRATKEGRNELEVLLSNQSPLLPLEGWKEPQATPLLRDTWVMSQPTIRVRDVQTKTWRGADATDFTAEVALAIKSDALNPRSTRLYYELLSRSGRRAAVGQQDMTLSMRGEDTLRFLVQIPKDSLWSAANPQHYTLRVKTQREGRYEEYQEHLLGFRSIEMVDGQMRINGEPVTLHIREVSPQATEDEILSLHTQGYNTLKLLPGSVAPALYELCNSRGIYIISQAPIDTHRSGDSRRVGGNPSNDPAWREAYLERATDSYHTSKRHPSVIAFSLAQKSANGINLYDSYLSMKNQGESRPMIYPDTAGEWNTDRLEMNLLPGKMQ